MIPGRCLPRRVTLFGDINMDLLRDEVGSLCVVLFLVYVVAFTKFFAVFQRLISC